MVERKRGHISKDILAPLLNAMELIGPISYVEICRDPDDDKFIEFARDARAFYIVSGDKDLLVLEKYEDIQIITAREFCELYLNR